MTNGIAGRTYLERGEPAVVLVQWRQQRKVERLDLPGLEAMNGWTPRNVLVRRADGELVVRPFRGLRRADPGAEDAPAASRQAPSGTSR
jgi:acetyl esterase